MQQLTSEQVVAAARKLFHEAGGVPTEPSQHADVVSVQLPAIPTGVGDLNRPSFPPPLPISTGGIPAVPSGVASYASASPAQFPLKPFVSTGVPSPPTGVPFAPTGLKFPPVSLQSLPAGVPFPTIEPPFSPIGLHSPTAGIPFPVAGASSQVSPSATAVVPAIAHAQQSEFAQQIGLNPILSSGFGFMGSNVSQAPAKASAQLERHVPVAQSQPASEFDGLRGFIAQIREADFRNASILCPEQHRPPSLGATTSLPETSRFRSRPLDLAEIRRDFPALHQSVHGQPLVWLDNAATTHKPQVVIDAVSRFYERDNSNIHRAAHTLAARATDGFEGARRKVQHFLGAGSAEEIVFVRGTTEGINLVANTYGRKHLQAGDEIVLTTLEHHANIVPWQLLAREKGLVLRVVPVNDRGEILMEAYQALLGPRTKMVALTHASNTLGTILPIAEMTAIAKRHGAAVLIDGAQTVAHLAVDVQTLGCDFFVFSGHKIFGPTGIGVVYGTEAAWADLPPWQGGGNMIQDVTFEETRYNDPPARFEAGTPNIADAIGLGVALDYLRQFGLSQIAAYEHELLQYATDRLIRIPGLRLIGTAAEKVGVLSFVLKNQRPEDVGRQLDLAGIAVRSGHHCAQPSLRRFGLEATVRPSLCFYNTREEIDRLAEAVKRIAR